MVRLQRHLLLHGSVVLIAGLLSGLGFSEAITGAAGADAERGWRVAHTGLVMGGLLLIAVSSALPTLRLPEQALAVLVWSLVAAGYAFTVALPYGAAVAMRGLEPAGPVSNWIVFTGNAVGALGSVVAALLLACGAFRSLRPS